jgi:hypothetical protein
MTKHPIPAASLQRMRVAQAQFQEMANMIAEAMGMDISQRFQLDLQEGVFLTEDPAPALEAERVNGVAAPA